MLYREYHTINDKNGIDTNRVRLYEDTDINMWCVSEMYTDYYDDMYGDAHPFIQTEYWEYATYEEALHRFKNEVNYLMDYTD